MRVFCQFSMIIQSGTLPVHYGDYVVAFDYSSKVLLYELEVSVKVNLAAITH